MRFSSAMFLDSIEEKKIYYFSSSVLNTNTPHNFICIKRTSDDLLILSCCTSKFETIKRFIETRNLPYETLVWLSENPIFTKDTYINCNQYFEFTLGEFRRMYENNTIEFRGEVSQSDFENIINGLLNSPLIDEEIKDILPKID
jgi:hypothetical protein